MGITKGMPHLTCICIGAEDPDSGPHAWVVSVLSTEPDIKELNLPMLEESQG